MHGIIYQNITSDEIASIYDEIYFQICSEFINNDVSDFIENAQDYFIANNNLYMLLDSELTQGTLLQLEYLINIKCAMNCTELTLQNEVDSKLTFDPNTKLISENKTNSDYGWEINEAISFTQTEDFKHNLVLTLHHSPNTEYVIKRGEPYQCKLILNCILNTKDDTNYSNKLIFRIKGEQKTAQGVQEVETTQMLNSIDVNLIPPFGKDKSLTNKYILLGSLSLTLISIFIYKKYTQ